MTTASASVEPRTWGVGEPWHEVEVPIRFRRRETKWLGYYVTRADTGQDLGMVTKDDRGGWKAMTINSAYYPPGTEIMERTQHHPSFHGKSWAEGYVVEVGCSTRARAADVVVWELLRRRAESLEDLVVAVRAKAGYPS